MAKIKVEILSRGSPNKKFSVKRTFAILKNISHINLVMTSIVLIFVT